MRHRDPAQVMASTLRTHELTKSYNGRTVVRGVSLEVNAGEVVGLLGPNGAGKTTTFYMAVGLTAADSGRVTLDGVDLTDDPMYVRARKGIGYLPQEPSIFAASPSSRTSWRSSRRWISTRPRGARACASCSRSWD
jgi:ABC-type lipopolysaccharide export system ATPase subunit